MDTKVVIDAASALAFLKRETGWDKMPDYLARGMISVINFAEIVQRVHRWGREPEPFIRLLDASGIALMDADRKTAQIAGDLERATRSLGISLADRFCFALALQRKAPIVTADTRMSETGLSVEVLLIR